MTATLVPLLYKPRGIGFPARAKYHAFHLATLVQSWTKARYGVTFNVGEPISRVSPFTWAELRGIHKNNWWGYLAEAAMRFPRAKPDHGYALMYFRPPVADNGFPEYMGGTFSTEVFGGSLWPRSSMDWSFKSWAMCGQTWEALEEKGWWVPWWDKTNPDPKKALAGGLAHEWLLHGLTNHSHTFTWGPNEAGQYEITVGYSNFENVYIEPTAVQMMLDSGYLNGGLGE